MLRHRFVPLYLLLLTFVARAAYGEVARVEVLRRDDAGTHERLIGRIYFKIDPKLTPNRSIADIEFAPTDKDGMVEFSGDFMVFVPKKPKQARGTVFLEIVNRGRDQSLSLM